MTLHSCSTPLAQAYDVALLDLDGVVYVGGDAVAHAAESLAAAAQHGMKLTYVTNNAARPPAQVAEHLVRLDIPATTDQIVTSAQTAAHYLSERLPAGARVLVVGTTGLIEALGDRGLTAVHSADDEPVAVVQGYSPDADWRMLAEGAVAIRRGVPWIATNLDATVPSPRGPLPGNGSLVAALRCATGATPTSVGKPDPTMHRETVERSGARHPLVVGDRLDTDIQGATAVGCDSLLVLTGVTDPSGLLHAPADQRPTYLARDLRGLLETHPAVTIHGAVATCRDWSAHRDGDQLILRHATAAGDEADGDKSHDAESGGDEANDGLHPLRALCALAWSLPGDQLAKVAVSAAEADARTAIAGLTLS